MLNLKTVSHELGFLFEKRARVLDSIYNAGLMSEPFFIQDNSFSCIMFGLTKEQIIADNEKELAKVELEITNYIKTAAAKLV
jgi:hypothetical protein